MVENNLYGILWGIMSKYSRGDKVTFKLDDEHAERPGTILGPEDFDGYEYNNPSNITGSGTWELVQLKDYITEWIPTKNLQKVDG